MEPEGKIAITESTAIPWTFETNWTIAAGSLENCVTFESSLSCTDDGDGGVESSTVDSSSESPLVLYPPSSDSGPCEIKVNFAQKHEVRQVYVRSTARVYEIYSESNLQIGNEYLCTVRCGIAARDDKVLHAPDVEKIVSLHQRGSKKGFTEESTKTEEDWVEVKVSDTASYDGRNESLQTKSYINSTKSGQDLFEATAEIADANPSTSVVLRLLSVQIKGCICIDEIYVFADPVALDDSVSQEIHKGSSSSSSLMAMLLPTLMQLSKTTGVSCIDDNYCSVSKRKEDYLRVDLQDAGPVGSGSITGPQEVKLQEVNQGGMSLSQPKIPSPVSLIESSHGNITPQITTTKRNCSDTTPQAVTMESSYSDIPPTVANMVSNQSDSLPQVATRESSNGDSLTVNIGRALEQLVSRMDRMEEICLGFQAKMLIPMNSIEERLQRVEQQIEILTSKFQNVVLPSTSDISAPDASCVESNANSCDNSHDCYVTKGVESDKKDFHTEVQSIPDGMPNSANSTPLLPGLVVIAPEFVDGEDEEENNALESERNSSDDKQGNALSIEDALASAFSGFVSSISSQSPKYARSLLLKAPEFSNEEYDNDNSNASPRTLHVLEENNSGHLKDSEGINRILVSTSSNISLESGEKVNIDPSVKQSEENAEEAGEHGQICGVERDRSEVGVTAAIASEHDSRKGFNSTPDEDESRETSLFLNESDIQNELLKNQTGCTSGCNITRGGKSGNSDVALATEDPERASSIQDIVKNILGIAGVSSAVNFEAPILDVEFISRNIADSKLSLEDVLLEAKETKSLDPSVKESSDDLIKEQSNSTDDLSVQEHHDLVSLDDGNLLNSAIDGHYSGDNDYCYALIDVPVVHLEGDNLPEDHERKNDEAISSSLV